VGKQTVAIKNATSATAIVTAPSCGYATVELAVTDDMGRVDTADVVLSPTSAASAAPADAKVKSCTVKAAAMALAVCPAIANVQVNGGMQAYAVTVANGTDDSVIWSVDGVVGGYATVGTITSAGVYTAPATVPAAAQVTITAASTVDQTIVSTATVNITSPSGSHGGGAMDPLTLLGEALALGTALICRLRSSGARMSCHSRAANAASAARAGRSSIVWPILKVDS